MTQISCFKVVLVCPIQVIKLNTFNIVQQNGEIIVGFEVKACNLAHL